MPDPLTFSASFPHVLEALKTVHKDGLEVHHWKAH